MSELPGSNLSLTKVPAPLPDGTCCRECPLWRYARLDTADGRRGLPTQWCEAWKEELDGPDPSPFMDFEVCKPALRAVKQPDTTMRTKGKMTETYLAIARGSGRMGNRDTELYGQFQSGDEAIEHQRIMGGRIVRVTETTEWEPAPEDHQT